MIASGIFCAAHIALFPQTGTYVFANVLKMKRTRSKEQADAGSHSGKKRRGKGGQKQSKVTKKEGKQSRHTTYSLNVITHLSFAKKSMSI